MHRYSVILLLAALAACGTVVAPRTTQTQFSNVIPRRGSAAFTYKIQLRNGRSAETSASDIVRWKQYGTDWRLSISGDGSEVQYDAADITSIDTIGLSRSAMAYLPPTCTTCGGTGGSGGPPPSTCDASTVFCCPGTTAYACSPPAGLQE